MNSKTPPHLLCLACGVLTFGLTVPPAALATPEPAVSPADTSPLLLAQSEPAQAEERAEAAEDARKDQAELAEENADDQTETAEQHAEAVADGEGQEGLRSSGGSELDEESTRDSATESTTEDWRGYGK